MLRHDFEASGSAPDDVELFHALLELFVASHGHASVPLNHEMEGHPLGRWCDRARKAYDQGALPAGRVARLEALPHWTWEMLPGESHAPVSASLEERAHNIYSTRGNAYRVDPELRPELARYHWNETKEGYAIRRRPEGSQLLQRVILDVTQSNLVVRFLNENPRDCRRENLELVHRTQRIGPSRNVPPWRGSSRFRGVSWSKRYQRWQAVIRVPVLDQPADKRRKDVRKSKLEWLGYFDTEIRAAEAVDRRAKEVWGDRAILNFAPETRRRRREAA